MSRPWEEVLFGVVRESTESNCKRHRVLMAMDIEMAITNSFRLTYRLSNITPVAVHACPTLLLEVNAIVSKTLHEAML
jgi:hypothetical protein